MVAHLKPLGSICSHVSRCLLDERIQWLCGRPSDHGWELPPDPHQDLPPPGRREPHQGRQGARPSSRLGTETLGTESFLVSVLVSVPVLLFVSSLGKVSVSIL